MRFSPMVLLKFFYLYKKVICYEVLMRIQTCPLDWEKEKPGSTRTLAGRIILEI
jgi:hypothetical protein